MASCTGCKTCVLACKDNKDLSAEISFRKVYEYGGGTWSQSDGLWSNDAFGYYVSVACNHCDSPACMAKCPHGAISKDPDTGIVNNDPEKCIGCGTCAIACPYSAPKVDEEIKKAVRCDMCADRVAEGKQPICVEACPLRALDFGEISELRQKYGEIADIAPLPSADETKPNIVITEPVNATGWRYDGVGAQRARDRVESSEQYQAGAARSDGAAPGALQGDARRVGMADDRGRTRWSNSVSTSTRNDARAAKRACSRAKTTAIWTPPCRFARCMSLSAAAGRRTSAGAGRRIASRSTCLRRAIIARAPPVWKYAPRVPWARTSWDS